MRLHVQIEKYRLREPFATAATTIDEVEVVAVALEDDGAIGVGEAAGVYYRGETPRLMVEQIESVRSLITPALPRDKLRRILPAGGARNAVDCALWDLEAKQAQRGVWEIAGVGKPKELVTLFTCGAAEPKQMARVARSYDAQSIKLKLLGDRDDAARLFAVRDAVPDVWMTVDANQGFSQASFDALLPVMVQTRVGLIEQPFPIGEEWRLDRIDSPIPFSADESAETLDDLPALTGRFEFVNIKLDKCGGLTEGLAMVRRARELGLKTYVGNMFGTSRAIAPAFILGQLCDVVELDGPLFLEKDRPQAVEYIDGYIRCSEKVWGGGT